MNSVTLEQETNIVDPRGEFDHFGTMVCFHKRYTLGDKHGMTVKEAMHLEQESDKHVVSLPLYLYDHSGISISVTPFSCPWDSGKVGFIYITKNEIRSLFNVKRVSKKLLNEVLDILRQEVTEYNQYLTGDVWCIVEKDALGNVVDSLGQLYGSEYARKEKDEWVARLFAEQVVHHV